MNYKKLNLEQLRELSKNNDLSTLGTREVLIKRLKEHDLNRFQNPESKKYLDNSEDSIHLKEQNLNQLEDSEPPKYSKKPSESVHLRSETSLFLKLKASNLTRYFSNGIIYPLALESNLTYKSENRKRDTFNITEEFLILFTNPINKDEEDDVYIEIIINQLELIQSEDNPSIYFSAEPLPISRVRKIYFNEAAQLKTFLATVEVFPDFFIPKGLCTSNALPSKTIHLDFSTIIFPVNPKLDTWKIKLEIFDRILGMFAFMKNAGIFYAEKINQYQEYTQSYFSAIGLINSKLAVAETKDVGLYQSILYPESIESSNFQRAIFKQIYSIINSNRQFSIDLAIDCLRELLDQRMAKVEDVREYVLTIEYLVKVKSHQVAFSTFLKNEAIKKNYALMSLLFLSHFPNKTFQHTDKQAVRNVFISPEFNISKGMTEFLLAVLGYYYGYKSMIKEDTNLKNLSDPTFSSLAKKQQTIKFKLATRLEKVIIESIFNWTKTQVNITSDYPFLEPEPELKMDSNWEIRSKSIRYIDKSVKVLGTTITVIEREMIGKNVLNEVESRYNSVIDARSMLAYYLFCSFGLTKSQVIEIIKANSDKIDEMDLMKLIDIDTLR